MMRNTQAFKRVYLMNHSVHELDLMMEITIIGNMLSALRELVGRRNQMSRCPYTFLHGRAQGQAEKLFFI